LHRHRALDLQSVRIHGTDYDPPGDEAYSVAYNCSGWEYVLKLTSAGATNVTATCSLGVEAVDAAYYDASNASAGTRPAPQSLLRLLHRP
jgi:hypothetical protein